MFYRDGVVVDNIHLWTPNIPNSKDESDIIIQERAVRIIHIHCIKETEHQLQMYIGKPASIGRGHVIKAVVELFKKCGYSAKMFVSAPTGCADVLIDGYTIHALLVLQIGRAHV